MNKQDSTIQKWFDAHKDSHPVNITLVHQLVKMNEDDEHLMDKFSIQLRSQSFDYYQGTGHRVGRKQVAKLRKGG